MLRKKQLGRWWNISIPDKSGSLGGAGYMHQQIFLSEGHCRLHFFAAVEFPFGSSQWMLTWFNLSNCTAFNIIAVTLT